MRLLTGREVCYEEESGRYLPKSDVNGIIWEKIGADLNTELKTDHLWAFVEADKH
jgi:hypothetical protein